MSYNKITVNSLAASPSGDIPINLSTYFIESSPSTNQIIKYNGTNWINSETPADPALDLAAGWITYSSYNVGNYYYRVGHYHMNRKSSSSARTYTDNTSLVNASSTNTPLGGTNTSWFESIRLTNTGTYLCMYSMNCPTGTSIVYQWEDHSGITFSNKVTIYSAINSYGPICCGIITTTATYRRVRVVCQAYSGNVKISPSQEALASSMTIIKLN